MSDGRHAWVDESIHVTISIPMYVLAAVIADPTRCESIRGDLWSLVRRPRRRIHWRDEEGGDRAKAVEVIAAAAFDQIVIVGTPVDPRKQERARRKCMQRLVSHLCDAQYVDTVWIESRTSSLNRADEAMIAALRGSRAISGLLRFEFARAATDPMLWAADVVAGAIAASYRGDPSYREVLAPHLKVVELDL